MSVAPSLNVVSTKLSPQEEAFQLARKIVELDLLRDEIWESLASIAGDHAYEVLRMIQNS
ncbi:hypothetical protein [Aquibacillus kalidii]|uniref:hypothetical protein n=1 Tax=Aquibacillus kalidii TaxID=2762597 RepID=UPI0016493683|nr:hypothetical protein [Aquibacillus kalidii]